MWYLKWGGGGSDLAFWNCPHPALTILGKTTFQYLKKSIISNKNE